MTASAPIGNNPKTQFDSSHVKKPIENSKESKTIDVFAMKILSKAKTDHHSKNESKITITVKDTDEIPMELLTNESMLFASAMNKVIKKLKELSESDQNLFKVSGLLQFKNSGPFLRCSYKEFEITITFPPEEGKN